MIFKCLSCIRSKRPLENCSQPVQEGLSQGFVLVGIFEFENNLALESCRSNIYNLSHTDAEKIEQAVNRLFTDFHLNLQNLFLLELLMRNFSSLPKRANLSFATNSIKLILSRFVLKVCGAAGAKWGHKAASKGRVTSLDPINIRDQFQMRPRSKDF